MVKYQHVNLNTVFAALADPTRRAILESLSHGPASVTQLAEPFDISLPAVSRHLAVLTEAGLIETEKDGRVHRMHLRGRPLKDAAAWLDRYDKFWNKRFDALEELLAPPKHSATKRGPHRGT